MQNQFDIFKSLFKGRDDVFAIRWEKEGKSGYMPAYDFDWKVYSKHKSQGGSLNNFPNKTYLRLTTDKLNLHFSGKEIIGIYPLLPDNTSWFIAADFDQRSSKHINWTAECMLFINECEKYELPIYLERSRSGMGGHIWMFFEQPFPAYKSRNIFHALLSNAGILALDRNSNFDRLFPNQDYHSGKGLGNLIALPFQKKALESSNSCFINPINLEAFPDQWSFIQNIQKISSFKLDEVFNKISLSNNQGAITTSALHHDTGKLQITLNNQITIQRNHLNAELIVYIRENLNLVSLDYLIKKKARKNTYHIEAYFKTLGENNEGVVLPRGFIGKLLRFCKEKSIPYELKDERKRLAPVEFKCNISLYEYQKTAVQITNKKDFGVIVAPPGAGKTVMGLSVIAEKQQPALIIVHRKQIFNQWIEGIQSFLGIPKFRIGKIEGGKCEIGHEITVAMIQRLVSANLSKNIHSCFGTILVDECHHIPAKTFREVIRQFHSYYLYGFTATPIRKNKDEKLIFIHLGDIIHQVQFSSGETIHNKQLSVYVRKTNLFTPFNSTLDNIETLLHILIHDTARNELIVNDITREVIAGRKVLVLTERKAHTNIINQYLRNNSETIVLTGDDSAQTRKEKLKQIKQGNFQVLIATGQFLGEGTDIEALDCLVLAYPFSFEGKLIQYIGRVQRGIIKPVIYDYIDHRIEYLNSLFKQRNRYYRKLTKNGQIVQYRELVLLFESKGFYINSKENSFPIDCLDLPLSIEEFLPGIAWRIRVIKYNEEEGELICEIIDYNLMRSDFINSQMDSFYFQGIEKIKFRSIDTAGFLRSVILKKTPSILQEVPANVKQRDEHPRENVLLKTMKVPFWKIRFLYGSVSFAIYIEEINQELTFEIENPEIRPEFEAIKEYFSKILKKKLIKAEIAIRYSAEGILSATAKSEDIDGLNDSVIESIRFEFIKKEIFKPSDESLVNHTNTIEDLLRQDQSSVKKLYSSDQELLDDILNIKQTKHILNLKYLSSKHEAKILKLRFVLQPFSFLFLLAGENNYHIVWETLDTEEATYIWHTEKSRDALRKTLGTIETLIGEIKKNGKMDYLKHDHINFTRILHDYSDSKKGFILWKGLLEERLK